MASADADSKSRMNGPVAVVLKGYPRLSETFIAQEILGLQRRGLDLRLVSLRHPTDRTTHPIHAEITAPVTYLPEYLHDEPLRVLRGWRAARRMAGYGRARAVWLRDLARDRTRNRVRRWGQALVMAAELPADSAAIYAHFLHTPGSVARYAAMIRGLPWAFSAHAKDIWTIPAWEKQEKLASARWGATCTAYGADHLRGLAPDAAVHLVHHGLDLDRFGPAPARTDGPPWRILTVGRAVEKKGLDTIIDALGRLDPGLDWTWDHIGGGPERDTLRARAASVGVAERCRFLGARPQTAVLEALRSAHLFVLASRVAADGDRDGLPNVLMEAQSQGVPVVATAVAAIPELIVDGQTGLLVPPDDVDALAAAMTRVLTDRPLAAGLATAGEGRVRSAFSHVTGIDRIEALIRAMIERPAT